MKKYLLSALLLVSSMVSWASPAKPGLWRDITLVDGTTVRVQLAGDEFFKFYQDATGAKYVPTDAGTYQLLSDTEISNKSRRAVKRRTQAQGKRKIGNVNPSVFQGRKKGIIILVNFTDKKFKSGHDNALYQNVLNGDNYTENGFSGSVKDYFKAQSNGQFELDFDVFGPCPLSHNVAYYGANDSNGDDKRPGEMVAEACLWAAEQGADFSQYDWDGDGYVDQVFVVYAGMGEADGGAANTIWPHMFYLSAGDYGKELHLNGVAVDTYACGSELNSNNQLAGIGTICHEFSHCMGFPDLYDTQYKGWFGMGDFDLMCSGSYNGNGYIPAGYSAYEKAECGWITLHDMTDISEKQDIEGMLPQSENGDAYIIKNKANANEYYIVENRQATGWDRELPGTGVMITHVDYDENIWLYNVPNTKNGIYYDQYDREHVNTHPRFTIFHADNSDDIYSQETDLYPYGKRNSLNKTSFPPATLYNKNVDGTNYMHIAINDMAIAADGTASLSLVPNAEGGDTPGPVVPDGSTLFYESFDSNTGDGGNDGVWSDISSNVAVAYDNVGWNSENLTAYGANQCIKVGSSKKIGTVTSPTFTVNGNAVLTFKAGGWDSTKDATSLTLTTSNGTLDNSEVTIPVGKWGDFSVNLNATGSVDLTFTANRGRFFLDEVKVVDANASGVENVASAKNLQRVVGYYSLEGLRYNEPQIGFNIVRYADGSTRKIMYK